MGNQLFHKVLKALKERDVQGQRLIVGLSSGIDSIVLLHLLQRASSALSLELFVFHAHHGEPKSEPGAETSGGAGGQSSKQSSRELSPAAISRYRARALAFAEKAAKGHNLPFAMAQSKRELKGEAAMRLFRHAAFQSERKRRRASLIALGHNRDDLLETRLIHLIRGCGREGLRAAPSAHLLKPLSSASRKDIEDYAAARSLKWIEDPGNQSLEPLRNWLRHKWLPLLEEERKGSLEALARSFSLISEYESHEGLEDLEASAAAEASISAAVLRRDVFLELSPAAQKRAIARFMRLSRLSGYGLSHIEEARKHILRPEKAFSFRLLKRVWRITRGKVSLEGAAAASPAARKNKA